MLTNEYSLVKLNFDTVENELRKGVTTDSRKGLYGVTHLHFRSPAWTEILAYRLPALNPRSYVVSPP